MSYLVPPQIEYTGPNWAWSVSTWDCDDCKRTRICEACMMDAVKYWSKLNVKIADPTVYSGSLTPGKY